MGRSKGIHPEGVPVVSTTDRAAFMLALDPERLARAVEQAGLVPWGQHSSGRPVWRWTDLLAMARALGARPPTSLDPGKQGARWAAKRDRGRANRYQARQP